MSTLAWRRAAPPAHPRSIPVRFRRGPGGAEEQGPDTAEVLMITTRGGQALVFPKGGWETDESVETAAQRETVEEAGVRGELEGPALGAFPFHSNKAERLHTANKGRCIAHVFVLHVTEELADWPEARQRQRVWVPLREAAARARDDWMREALAAWVRRRGWEAALQQQASAASPPVELANGSAPPPAPPAAVVSS
eukprot:scaffold1.g5778.t1